MHAISFNFPDSQELLAEGLHMLEAARDIVDSCTGMQVRGTSDTAYRDTDFWSP